MQAARPHPVRLRPRSSGVSSIDIVVRAVRDEPPMRMGRWHVWLVLLASMDIMLTWLILQLGGSELNPLAAGVILTSGHLGMVSFKFALVLLVIVICEYIAERHRGKALMLSIIALSISAFPVVWSIGLLYDHSFALLNEVLHFESLA